MATLLQLDQDQLACIVREVYHISQY